jgi:DNA polymerase-3 subunit gamma/tau
MDKFIVSARKYRPQTFDTVVGQQHITTTLKNAIKNNQLAHAFLFCGPRGVGKTTCARILAKTINCTNIQENGEACNTCVNCQSFNEGGSLNIHELDAASNNSVDDIRQLVENVRFAPQAGKYKVYIVDEVHMLTQQAFNAFLKTLEEPPPFAIFILATTEKHKILPTILSRCQIFDFKRITLNHTVEHLQEIIAKENINADRASLQVIAQKSEGCMRDALSILDKIVSFTNGSVTYQNTLEHLNILDHDYFFKLLDFLQQEDLAQAMLLYNEINAKGFEGDMVLNGFAEFLRNVLVCKDANAAALLEVVDGLEEKYHTASKQVGVPYLVSALNILNEAELNYKMARNKRLHVELSLIKLNFLKQAIELTSEGGSLVKKKKLSEATLISTKKIIPLQAKPIQTSKEALPKLYIQNQETNSTISEAIAYQTVVQEPVQQPQRTSPTNAGSGSNKKSLLDVLKQKAGDKYTVEVVKEAIPLEIETLQNCWNTYALRIEEQGGKPSTVSTLRGAKLNITSDYQFTITVHAITQQRFIEQEKTLLLEAIHNTFNNRAIQFSFIIDESEVVPIATELSSRQRYEKIIQDYPLVKEFKEKLKLDLDI